MCRWLLTCSYKPLTRQATSSKPNPMIHDQVAIWSLMRTTPKCPTSATINNNIEMTHTAIVGALPELRILFFLWLATCPHCGNINCHSVRIGAGRVCFIYLAGARLY